MTRTVARGLLLVVGRAITLRLTIGIRRVRYRYGTQREERLMPNQGGSVRRPGVSLLMLA